MGNHVVRKVGAAAAAVILLVLLGSLAFTVLPHVVGRNLLLVVSDRAYLEAAMIFGGDAALFSRARSDGWSLVIRQYPASVLTDKAKLEAAIASDVGRARRAIVVCSPLATLSLSRSEDSPGRVNADLSASVALRTARGEDAMLVGIGPAARLDASGQPVFDMLLVPASIDAGWLQAADALAVASSNSPLPVALLYSSGDVRAQDAAAQFKERFGDVSFLVDIPVERTSTSARIAQATMQRMKDLGVLWVACPYVEYFHQFSRDPSSDGIRWVVDSLLASLVDASRLEGVVADDLASSLLPVLAQARWQGGDGEVSLHPLERVFRRPQTAVGNLLSRVRRFLLW